MCGCYLQISETGIRYAHCRTTVFPPSEYSKAKALEECQQKKPESRLELEYITGYSGCVSGRKTRSENVHMLASGEVLYPASAVVVILDPSIGSQRFYRQHTDDVFCITVHPMQTIVASGQVGQKASICIFDTQYGSKGGRANERTELVLLVTAGLLK